MTVKTSRDELRIETFDTEEGNGLRILTDGNETGMLFRISAVFYVHKLSIVSASIKTPDSQVVDEFIVVPESGPADRIKAPELEALGADLKRLLNGLSVLEYLAMQGDDEGRNPRANGNGRLSPAARVEIEQEAFGPVIRLRGTDRPGLMLTLSQTFFLTDIDILNASITTGKAGEVVNTFEVNPTDARFTNDEFKRRLGEELRVLL